jgi:hypothetical protein
MEGNLAVSLYENSIFDGRILPSCQQHIYSTSVKNIYHGEIFSCENRKMRQ